MKLSELLIGFHVLEVLGDPSIDVLGIASDSRRVERGSVFVAQVGTSVDGHSFIPQCVTQGAAAIVIEKKEYMPKSSDHVVYVLVESSDEALGKMAHIWYGSPSTRLKLVGVTGTNGKTTTATLLYRLFKSLGERVGLLSTVVNYVNDEAIPATHTTPDALSLNALLAQMVNAGCTYAFMEVSSHAIAQQRIAGLEFDGALFTNLTRDHMDYHKTFDHYRDTKKKLFDGLSKQAFAITNIDDRNGLVMTQNTAAQVFTYSTRSMATHRGKILEEGFEGMLLRIQTSSLAINTEVWVPLVGRFNVSNLLLIYATAVALGADAMDVLRVLSSLQSVNGRFETIRAERGWTAVIDYAHTPDAVENVLKTINDIVDSQAISREHRAQVFTVVGCGGNRDKGKRPMMARIAYNYSTQLILTSDNPRDEEPQAILQDMAAGLTNEELKQVLLIEDRASAIKTACALARSGDVVLVAGKGHEDYQIIKGIKYHFDDHEIVRECAKI